MTMQPDDIQKLVAALAPVLDQQIRGALDGVYAAIDQLRDEFSQTIQVLDANDHAVVAEVQRLKGADIVAESVVAWERFIDSEYTRLLGRKADEMAKKSASGLVAKS